MAVWPTRISPRSREEGREQGAAVVGAGVEVGREDVLDERRRDEQRGEEGGARRGRACGPGRSRQPHHLGAGLGDRTRARCSGRGRRAWSEMRRRIAMSVQFARREDPPDERNGIVRPVSGMTRVTPPTTTKHCSARRRRGRPRAARRSRRGRRARSAGRAARGCRRARGSRRPRSARAPRRARDDEVGLREVREVGPTAAEPGADIPRGHAHSPLASWSDSLRARG